MSRDRQMRVNDAIARPLPHSGPQSGLQHRRRRSRRIAPWLLGLVTLTIAGLGLVLALRHGAL